MTRVRALILVALGLLAGAAHAQVTEIYKCTDEKGRPLYTSDKRDTAGRKCELVSREINVVPSQKAPAGFPRESATARANARERQRDILQKELQTEEELLAKAKQALAEQEAVRSGDERNYARVLERLQPYRDNVGLHEKNIEALKRELGSVR